MRLPGLGMLMLLNFSCGISTGSDSNPLSQFDAFYSRFHRDTAFQFDHILFPLAGQASESDTTIYAKPFRWYAKDWVWHRPFPEVQKGYDRSVTRFENGMVLERIVQRTTGMGIERRFAVIDGQWMLIYYAGLHQMTQ